MHTRRDFLARTAVVAAGTTLGLHAWPAFATPLGLPLGLQLYSVREMLAKDYAGTLKQLAGIGYKEVESAGFFGHRAAEVKAALTAAGLTMPSSHYPATALAASLDEAIPFNQALGVRYIVCAFPALKHPERVKGTSHRELVESFTMDDYRWNAEQLNTWGRKVKAAGMQLAYHNHTMEFTPLEGTTGFDEMLRLTDPELVSFEMDCGWVSVGGGDPAALLKKYPSRISMLHIKDFKPSDKPYSRVNLPEAAELGKGNVQFKPIFAASAEAGHVRHMFVEQEAYDIPPLDALRIDAQYMQAIRS